MAVQTNNSQWYHQIYAITILLICYSLFIFTSSLGCKYKSVCLKLYIAYRIWGEYK